MSAQGHESRVSTIPPCDFCKRDETVTPATHDGRTPYGWAFMCDPHWEEHGPGSTGLGIGQRLVLAGDVPEPDPDCQAHPSAYAKAMEDSIAGTYGQP